MHKVKVGVIGCGKIAQQVHIPNYIQNPRSKLSAISDSNKETLTNISLKYGIEHTFENYEEMLDSGLVEAVSVCVPTGFHSDVVIKAARKGVHVLCEKPLAPSLGEADEMLKAVAENKIKFSVGYNLRFLQNHVKVKEYLESGKIGQPIIARANLVTTGPYAADEKSFARETKKRIGCLFDSGAHIADLMLWMFGEPLSLSASFSTHMAGVQVDDAAMVSIKFKSGLLGEISVAWVPIFSYAALETSRQIQIIGAKGTIDSDIFGPSFQFYSPNSMICKLKGKVKLTPTEFDPRNPAEGLNKSYAKEIDSFLESVARDKNPAISGEEARQSLKLILAAYESGKSGTTISLS